MKMNVYAVLDAKIGSYGNLFLDFTDESAIRGFTDGVNNADPQNKWYSHPEDFTMYRLGDFDQATGTLKAVSPIVSLVNGSALKKMKEILEG